MSGNNEPIREKSDGPPVTERPLPNPKELTQISLKGPSKSSIQSATSGFTPIITEQEKKIAAATDLLSKPLPPTDLQVEQQALVQERAREQQERERRQQFIKEVNEQAQPPKPGPAKDQELEISPPPGSPTFGQSPVVAQQPPTFGQGLKSPTTNLVDDLRSSDKFGRQTQELLRGVSFKYENEKYKLYPQVSNQQGEPLTFQEDQLDQCAEENCFTFTPRTDESLLAKYFLTLFFSNKYTEIKAVLDDKTENLSEYQQKISEIRKLINKELIDYALNTDAEIQDVDAKRNYGKKLTFTVASIFYAMENDINVNDSKGSGQRRKLDRNEINMILRNLFKREIFKGDNNKDREILTLSEQIIKLYIGEIVGENEVMDEELINENRDEGDIAVESETYWLKFLPSNLNFNNYDISNENNKKAFEKLKEIITNYEGFSEPLRGIENPRSSIDVTDLRSVKSTEDETGNVADFEKYFDITLLQEPLVKNYEIRQALENNKEEDESYEGESEGQSKEGDGPDTESKPEPDTESNPEPDDYFTGGAVIYTENVDNFNKQIFMIKYENSTEFVVPIKDKKNKQIIITFYNFYDILNPEQQFFTRYVDYFNKINNYEGVEWFSINIKPEFITKSEQLNNDELSNQLRELGEEKEKILQSQQPPLQSMQSPQSQQPLLTLQPLSEITSNQQKKKELEKKIANEKKKVKDQLIQLFTTTGNDKNKNEIFKKITEDQQNIIYDTLSKRNDEFSEDEQQFMDYYKIKNIQTIYNSLNKKDKNDILHLLYDYGDYQDANLKYKKRREAVESKYNITEDAIKQIQNEFYNNNGFLQQIIMKNMGPVQFSPSSSVDIAQQSDRRSSASTTSKDDLGFMAPLVPVKPSKVGGNNLTKTYRNFPPKKSITLFNTRRNLDSTTPTPLKLYAHINKKRFTRNKKRAHKKTQRSP